MRRFIPKKLFQRSCVICLALLMGVLTSASPLMALPPPPPCGPGEFDVGDPISLSLSGPTSAFDIWQPATFTATASDKDYCPSDQTRPDDRADKFTWYVDDVLYSAGNNLSQITLSFGAAGSHTVKVVADDYPYYADDPAVNDEVTVTVIDATEYTYDKNGNRASMTDPRGTTSYEYDVLSRLTKVTEPDGKWIAYEYDSASNRTKMTTHSGGTPAFNHVTQYQYNDRGLLSKVTDQLGGETTYTYRDNGLADTVAYPNGTKAVYSYNSRNWLTCISNQKTDQYNTVIAKFTYTYDPTYWGNSGAVTRAIENILKPDGNRINAQVDYEYDDLYRLVHEHRIAYGGGDPGVAYEYNFTYDAAGNRTSWVAGGTTTSYTYDAAKKMTGPGTFTYDDKGNTTQIVSGGVTTTYTWNYLNRMTRWAKTGATTEDYVYNADGMRVRKTPSGGTATDFMLDGKEIAEEITGSSATAYVRPGFVSRIAGGVRTVCHPDGLGSTRAMSDCSTPAAVIEAGVYDAYGNLLISSGAAPCFGYVGRHRYYADATGLDYLKARYYAPATGRFVSRDPVYGGANPYEYARSSPTMYADPTGKLPQAVIMCGIGAVGGLVAEAADEAFGGTTQTPDWCRLGCMTVCGCITGAVGSIYPWGAIPAGGLCVAWCASACSHSPKRMCMVASDSPRVPDYPQYPVTGAPPGTGSDGDVGKYKLQ